LNGEPEEDFEMVQQRNLRLLLLAAVILASSCATTETYRVNPRFYGQSERIGTVAILPPQVKVYQIDAGGVREEMTEWSTAARNHLVNAITNQLAGKMHAKVDLITGELLDENKPRWEDAQALHNAVSMMILLHTYQNPNLPNHYFEEKFKGFDYSLGSDVRPLARGASAMLLLDAEDHVWTGGRVALQTLGVILGVGAGVATGVMIVPHLSGGTFVKAALLDSDTGDILWFNVAGAGAGTDLRDAASATKMIEDLFKNFPPSHDEKAAK
jgi:hypothetical protein